MAKNLLQKMFAKPEYKITILHVPDDLKSQLSSLDISKPNDFILSFYTKKTDLQTEIKKLKDSLSEKGLLWIAYPKAKLLETDLNRDILHETMKEYGFDGVSIISINEIWAAMRFKF